MRRSYRGCSFLLTLLAVFVVFVGSAQAGPMGRAKYVFLFIGDGMASVQIHAAEAYLANKVQQDQINGSKKAELLTMSKLPVQGMATTFPYNSLITDSAPAGTALATGKKTTDGVISMGPYGEGVYTTIAEVAKAAGMKVGIVSSVSIDHATPATFYAHNKSRNNYHEIGLDLANSGFDYFGGGGFIAPQKKDSAGNVVSDVIATAISKGYVIAKNRAAFDALNPAGSRGRNKGGQKVIAINPILDGAALYYDIDRSFEDTTKGNGADHITLAEFTAKGIELLDNPEGFFMMVEGGKIDWACHANDARTSIDDTIAFDDAIKVALEFMKRNPQTLIVVTGDHETGGLSMGWAGTGYASFFEKLEPQNVSYVEFGKILKKYIGEGNIALPWNLVYDHFGLDASNLKPFQVAQIDAAWQRTLDKAAKIPAADADVDSLLYGGYEPFTVKLTHVLNNNAGIGWTSYAHTAVPVPVLAGGASAELFDGFYDNTDVAKKIARAMRLTLPN
jgi:alkaline phosphatase